MRKLLLLLSVVFCSLGAVAQECQSYVNENFKKVKVSFPADNSIRLDWQYAPVTEDVEFEIYYHDKKASADWQRKSIRRIKATDPLDCAKDGEGNCKVDGEGNVIMEELTPEQEYTTTIYDMDLTDDVAYRFEIKVQKGSSDVETIYIYEEGGEAKAISNFACATIYEFTYGLEWASPATANEKSSSVTLNWEKHAEDDGDFVYQVFGVKHDVLLATTTTTSATITNLELGEHSFVVRAFANGVYKASTDECSYTAKQVDCVTFPMVSAKGNTVTLTILGYDNDGPFSSNINDYTLTNGSGIVTNKSLSNNGTFTFAFNTIDLTKEFKLTTTKTNGVKAIGLFMLKGDGTLSEQYCDIVFRMKATHVTQHTVTLNWSDPGFEADQAVLQVYKGDAVQGNLEQEIEIPNPRVYTYSLGGLEHSTDYTFVLKLSDNYNNQSKSNPVSVTTKVGSICGLEGLQDGATWVGCGDGQFLMPYDLEFYTAYRDKEKTDPYVVARFRPQGTQQISDVTMYATTERGDLGDVTNLTTAKMTLGADGWYSCELDKYSYLIFWKRDITQDLNLRFSVSVKHNSNCDGKLWQDNTYFTKFASYKVGTGCQDDLVYRTMHFTKTYPEQTQFTLQTNGRIASVGVFPNDSYNLNERKFYNSFDDSPSSFTLDITDYAVGTYYLHIHDVYGEAESLKYLWAIY